jgi:hypothetical protein
MTRIRKFESFSTTHRLPEKVTYDEWLAKYGIHGLELFTQKEIEFFEKLIKENRLNIESYKIDAKKVTIVMAIEIGDISENNPVVELDIIEFEFRKLKDEWYLISKNIPDYFRRDEYYIGDEWDEVLGYLESINLKLPL